MNEDPALRAIALVRELSGLIADMARLTAMPVQAVHNNRPKLTKREASHIRELKRSGYKVNEIAAIYDVHHATVSRIVRGYYHK